MMKQTVPTLQECRKRFATFGECHHYHTEWIKPHGTKTQIKTCMVCAKTFEKKYPTQAQIVHDEILKALRTAKTKKELYDMVEKNTDAPRPTVRRVATDVRKQLEQYMQILGETQSTEYDCPECNTKRIIKRTDNECPNCKVELEWK